MPDRPILWIQWDNILQYVGSIQLLHQWQYTDNYRKNVKCIPYSRKLSRERTFVSFVVLRLFEFLRLGIFWGGEKRAICKSFLRENCIFHQFTNVFSPKIFCYIRYMHKFQHFISGTLSSNKFPKLFPTNKKLHTPSCQWFIDQPVCSWDPVSQADRFV